MSGGDRPPAEAQQGAEPGAHPRPPEVHDLRPRHRNTTPPLLRLRPAPLAAAAAGERVLPPQRGQEPVRTMVGLTALSAQGEAAAVVAQLIGSMMRALRRPMAAAAVQARVQSLNGDTPRRTVN